jgi:hypothetical protein
MSFTFDDLREIKRAISDLGKRLSCPVRIESRALCAEAGEGCVSIFGVYKITEEGTTLIRYESYDGVEIIAGVTLTECNNCEPLLLIEPEPEEPI